MEGRTPQDIVGKRAVKAFATFCDKNMEELKKVGDESLINYCNEYEFTKAEYDAFKRGTATILDFFLSCYKTLEE